MKYIMYIINDKYFWFLDITSYYEEFSCNRRNSYLICIYSGRSNFNV